MNPFVKRSLIVAAILAGIAGVSATAIAQSGHQHQGMGAGKSADHMAQMMQRHGEHQTQPMADGIGDLLAARLRT